ncbi:MAG: type II secretion system protein M [Burkholderiales bacterium]|jgi:type II secretory pathway component PulM|nr:type II secretion system protein M [Burkholderiales bacterium]
MDALAPTLKTRFYHAKASWQARPKRERLFAVTLLILFAGILFWFLMWTPMTRDLAAQNLNLPKARAALLSAQQAWRNTAGLSSAVSQNTDALDATLTRFAARFGLSAQLNGVKVNDRTVSCTLTTVSMDALTQWLDALAKDALLFPTALTLTPLAQNNAVRADITLTRPLP